MFYLLALITFTSFLINGVKSNETEILKASFSVHDVSFQHGAAKNITLNITGTSIENLKLDFHETVDHIIQDIPSVIVNASDIRDMQITMNSLKVGHTILYVNATPNNMTDLSEAYMRVDISHSDSLDYLSDVVGWVYFVAWSISFYPQTYLNFRRKSVIGLHFDFLALNVIGFLYYSVFNIGLYWIPSIEEQYFSRHQYGVNPVQLNDVIFAIHAFFACIIQVSFK